MSVRVSMLVAAWLGIAAPLIAQCTFPDPGGAAPIAGGTGADLIVRDIPAVNAYGSAGGFYGYSIGITTCNLGTAEVPWSFSTADHPVTLQNLYRLRGGRLEQIGASWMRHGFAALAQDACSCGCVPGSIESLGIGCSDVTSAAVNGAPSSLAPRSELIDPALGSFIWPSQLNPPATDPTSRRIRVAGADLDPALNGGAQYFLEGIVYSAADIAAGNAANRATVREATVIPNPSSYPLQLSGVASPTRSVLDRWAELDPTVVLTPIDDGSGGSLLLAAKVTEVSPGVWAYEYALANLDSTRAAEAFTVPTGSSTPGALGFRDVDPHSGDVLDGTDWTDTAGVGSVAWETTPFSVDPLANALRAGALYNFRFVTDLPPVTGSVAVRLFLPGTPTEVSVATLAPAGALDCNGNGVPDGDDITNGTSEDCDGNGVPDECDVPVFLRGDANGDLSTDVADAIAMLGHIFQGQPDPCRAAFDANADDAVNIADAISLLAGLFSGGPPPSAPWPGCGIDPDGTALECCMPNCP